VRIGKRCHSKHQTLCQGIEEMCGKLEHISPKADWARAALVAGGPSSIKGMTDSVPSDFSTWE
jgi:hypothetical protein